MAAHTVHTELNRLDVLPADAAERYVAQRALVRYENLRDSDVDTVCASEDWVRLLIALRRRAHPHHTRITLALFKQWKAKVTSSTSVKRSALSWRWRSLMLWPNTRLIWKRGSSPRMSWCSQAYIYTDGILIIDDGYGWAKLNVPGVLHIERNGATPNGATSGLPSNFRPLQRLQ